MEPLYLKLRCTSWSQVAAVYRRDLSKGRLFLQTSKGVAAGVPIRVDLALPSDSVVALSGVVAAAGDIAPDEKRHGLWVHLDAIPQSGLWMIETALSARREMSISGEALGKLDLDVASNEQLASAEQELLSALDKEYVSMKRLNAFQILGVSYGATDDHVRTAFAAATKRYHPDRYARFSSPRIRSLAAELFLLIRDAYQKLHTAEARTAAMQAAQVPAPRAVGTPSKPPPRTAGRITLTPRKLDIPELTAAPGVPAALDPPTPVNSLGIPKEASAPGVSLSGVHPRVQASQRAATPPPLPPTMSDSSTKRGIPHPAGSSTKRCVPNLAPSPLTPPTIKAPPVKVPNVSSAAPAATRRKTRPSMDAVAAPVAPEETIPVSKMGPLPSLSPGVPTPTPEVATVPTSARPSANPIDKFFDAHQYDDALAMFRAALRANPSDRSALAGVELAEGYKALAARDRLEAAQRFEAVLELDPSNERAARALADMRNAAQSDRKGMMSKLMGKKE